MNPLRKLPQRAPRQLSHKCGLVRVAGMFAAFFSLGHSQDFAPDRISNMLTEWVWVSGSSGFPPFSNLESETGVSYLMGSLASGALSEISRYAWVKTGPRTGVLSLSGASSGIFINFTAPLTGTFRQSTDTYTMTFRPFPVRAQAPPVRNGSTRLTLVAGQTSTMGFVVDGLTPRRILVRAVGPSLAQFGIANPVASPVLTVFRGSIPVATNRGWGGAAATAAVFDAVRAFPLSSAESKDCVVIIVASGAYTAQVSSDSAGEVLLEVYFVD